MTMKKIRAWGIMLIAVIGLVCAVFFCCVQKAEAAEETPQYKLTFSGTIQIDLGGTKNELKLNNKTVHKVPYITDSGLVPLDFYMYLTSPAIMEDKILGDGESIPFSDMTFSSTMPETELILYDDETSSVIESGLDSITTSLGDGRYFLELYASKYWPINNTYLAFDMFVTAYFTVDTTGPTLSGASTTARGLCTNKEFTVAAYDVSGVKNLYMMAPGETSFSSVGASSITIPDKSRNGQYNFYATDSFGYMSRYYYVYFDDVVPIGTLKNTGSSETVPSGSYTNRAFSYQATDNGGSGILAAQVKRPGSSSWASYTIGSEISASSANGWYTFRAQDKAGNFTEEVTICLDTAKPGCEISRDNTPVDSGSCVNSSFIKFVANDTLSGIAQIYVQEPGKSSYSVYGNGSPLVEEGIYRFYAIDRAGNNTEIYSITLDKSKPTGTLFSGTATILSGSIVNGDYIKFVGSDRISGVDVLFVRKPGSADFIDYTSGTPMSSDGRYEFYCEDLAGNKSSVYTVTLDRTNPTGKIFGGELELSSGAKTNAAYVLYTGEDALSGIAGSYVKLPGSDTFESYTSGTQYTADGFYEFYSIDVAGNESARYTVMLDKTLPIGQLYGGASAIGNGCHVNSTYIKFTASDATSGLSKLYVLMPGDDAYSEYNSITQLTAEGQYSFYATDLTGNRSQIYTVTLDRIAPSGILFAADAEIASGAMVNAEYITFLAEDALCVPKLFVKRPGNTQFEEYAAGTRFDVEGNYEFYGEDYALNRSSVLSVMLDQTKPELKLYAGKELVLSNAKSNAGYVSLTAHDEMSGIARIYVKLPDTNGYVEYTSGTQLTNEGEYAFYATDAANNVSGTVTVLLDRTKPTGQLYAATAQIDHNGYTNASYVKFAAVDDASGISALFVKMPGDTEFLAYDSVTLLTAPGKYEFYATDIANNRSDVYVVTIDRIAPVGRILAGNTTLSDNQTTNAEFVTYQADDGTAVELYVKKPNAAMFTKFITGERFTADGAYEFYSVDLSGNRSVTMRVVLDRTIPVGKLWANGLALDSGSFTNAANVYFTASDLTSGIRSLFVKLPGKSDFTVYESGTKLFENGRYEFKATDAAGNQTDVFSVILDNIAPNGQIRSRNTDVASGSMINLEYVTFSATDLTSGIAHVYVKIDNGEWRSYSAGTKIFDEGEMRFYCVDAAGNRSPEYVVTVDRKRPEGKFSVAGEYTNVDFSYTATDDRSGVAGLEMKTPGGDWRAYQAGSIIPGNSTNGLYFFRCVDFAGNISVESSICLDTVTPTGQLYVNGNKTETGTYTNLERIHFIAEDENIAACYVLEPGAEEWKHYTSGALYSSVGKYEFYIVDQAHNRSATYRIVIDRTSKPLTLNNVTNGETDGNVTITWTNGETDVFAPVMSVTVNGLRYEKGSELNTIFGGTYLIRSTDAAGNVWETEFLSTRKNILTSTVNKEWWEAADQSGAYYSFASYDSALDYATAREHALVRTGLWTNGDAWDTGIMMDSKDSVNAQLGTYFIYKKSGDPGTEVAYFTEARLLEVIREYAETGIRHYYYWNGSPSSAAEGENIFGLNTEGIYLADRIELSDKAVYYIDGRLFDGTVYDTEGRHDVLVIDEWGNETTYTFVIVRKAPKLRLAVGDREFVEADMLRIYYLKQSAKIRIADAHDEFAMYILKDADGSVIAMLSADEEYSVCKSGKYTVQAVNHYGMTEELTIYISLDAPSISFDENADDKQLIVSVRPSTDEYAKLQSLTIYKSVDEGKSWVVLTVDDYGNAITTANLLYKFRTGGRYRVRLEDTFHTGFEALESSKSYVQPIPVGILTGVENAGYTNTDVTFAWSDEAEVTVKLNGERMEYVSGATLSADGFYEILFENYDGYACTYNFTIDKIAPDLTIDGVENGGITNGDVTVEVAEEELDVQCFQNGTLMENFSTGILLTSDGAYRVVVTDKAGNVTEKTFSVDKTVSFSWDTFQYGIANSVSIDAQEDLVVDIARDGEAVEYIFGEALTIAGHYTVKLTDPLGNTELLLFVIPEPLTSGFSHDLKDIVGLETIAVNGEELQLSNQLLALSDSGAYEVSLTVNGKLYTFSVSVDATAPTLSLEGVENGGATKDRVVLGEPSEKAEQKVYFNGSLIDYVSGSELTESGQYRVILTDSCGNTTEYMFEILKSMNGGLIALIVIAAIVLIGGAVFIILKKKKVF